MTAYDIVVVGAGPAGSAAALCAARTGARVALIERGPFPGAKNLYGGVLYLSALDRIIPDWRDRAPIQRMVTKRSTMIINGDEAVTVSFEKPSWARPPYNGVTALRSEFDYWLAKEAQRAGAELICSTTVKGVRYGEGSLARQVIGVSTDQDDGDIDSKVTIAADGVNSFLARQVGLYPRFSANNLTLGYKEVLKIDPLILENRFGVSESQGVDIEILGAVGAGTGGGFLYTNSDSLSIGVIVTLDSLAKSGQRPDDLLTALKAHPVIAPYLANTNSIEVGAHLIPEGGWGKRPKLSGGGVLVAGDAASLCLAAGLWLEGVNMAIESGILAGETAGTAVQRGHIDDVALKDYDRALEASFAGKNAQRLTRASSHVLSETVQHQVPILLNSIANSLFEVTDPIPKPRLSAIFGKARRDAGLSRRALLRLAVGTWRAFR